MKSVKTLLSTAVISTLLLGANAMSADYRSNPFTLTYDNAITQNVKGKVNIHPVKYVQKHTDIEGFCV